MNIINKFERYLYDVLRLKVEVINWNSKGVLPIFLEAAYSYYTIDSLSAPCLVMVMNDDSELTPASIEKHINLVQKKWNGFYIIVAKTLTTYNRQRLIERHIPFVIPGNQCYLPFLGVDLREYYRKPEELNKLFLGPASQSVVIYALKSHDLIFDATRLSQKLSYSVMTISRAFDELETLNIGEFKHIGSRRLLAIPKDKIPFWNRVQKVMRSPVKKTLWLKCSDSALIQVAQHGIVSGISALASLSMLNEPRIPVYAVGDSCWKILRENEEIEQIPSPDEADIELEIWSYNPKLFADNDIVDPFSLYLILREVQDDRVEIALDKMMKKVVW